MDLPIRTTVAESPTSRIRQVADAGFNRPGALPLWFGEGDRPTADFICEAAVAALRRGETFYGENSGLLALRSEIARYLSSLRGVDVASDRITVTPSGVNAIMVVMQCLLDAGSNVVMVTPVWPNCATIVNLMGSQVRRVNLELDEARWTLDVAEIERRIDDNTRAIFVNSPNNPTGWMATEEDVKALVDLSRRHRVWLVMDEVYERIVFGREVSVSALDHATPDDLIISVNSFSKAWNMTGWRLGWLVTPAALRPHLAKLNEANTSNPPVFIQHAGIAALRDGENVVQENRRHYADNREYVIKALSGISGITLSQPDAAFYAFFQVAGVTDSLAYAQNLLVETGVGIAPGLAFGDDCENWFRICFASGRERLKPALDKLIPYLAGSRA